MDQLHLALERADDGEYLKSNIILKLLALHGSTERLLNGLEQTVGQFDDAKVAEFFFSENEIWKDFFKQWLLVQQEYTDIKENKSSSDNIRALKKILSPYFHEVQNHMSAIMGSYQLLTVSRFKNTDAAQMSRMAYNAVCQILRIEDLCLSQLNNEKSRAETLIHAAFEHKEKFTRHTIIDLVNSAKEKFPSLELTIRKEGSKNEIVTDGKFFVDSIEAIFKNIEEAGGKKVSVTINNSRIVIKDDGDGLFNDRQSDRQRLRGINHKLLQASLLSERPDKISVNPNKPQSRGEGLMNAAETLALYHDGAIYLEELFDEAGKFSGICTTMAMNVADARDHIETFSKMLENN